jgi:hypothetical protein
MAMTAAEAANVAVLKRSYAWANQVMGTKRDPIVLADIETFFAAEAEMVTNDKMKCKGLQAHLKHFQEIQSKTRNVVFDPFEITVADEDRVGVYFKIHVEYCDGRKTRIFVAGFFRLSNEKIVNFTEIAHFEGDVFHLENH